MGGRILSQEASDKPQVPASTQGMGVGGTGWPWRVGGEGGQGDSSLAGAVPTQGQFSVRTTWVSEPVSRKGQPRCSLTSFRRWGHVVLGEKHRQATNFSLLVWLPLVIKHSCRSWWYIFFSVMLWVFLSFHFYRHSTWCGQLLPARCQKLLTIQADNSKRVLRQTQKCMSCETPGVIMDESLCKRRAVSPGKSNN